MFFGCDEERHDPAGALELARTSTHPDAIWFCALADKHTVARLDSALLRSMSDDVRAFYFALKLDLYEARTSDATWQKAADMGYHPAEAEYALTLSHWPFYSSYQAFVYATRAATGGGEPLGFFVLGRSAKDKQSKINFFNDGFRLGHIPCARHLYHECKRYDPLRYEAYFVISAHYHNTIDSDLLRDIHIVTQKFFSERRSKYGVAVYTIGHHLTRRDWICGELTTKQQAPFDAILDHYQVCNTNARAAVDAWSMVAKRVGVVKDIRLMIARMIWDERVIYAKKLDYGTREEKRQRRK